MNPQTLAGDRVVDAIPAQNLLEGLARLYRRILVLDGDGRIVWLSQEMGALCGIDERHLGVDVRALFPECPEFRNEFAIRSQLRTQGALADLHLDLHDTRGEVSRVALSFFPIRLADSKSQLYVAIARPVDSDEEGEDPGKGLPAAILAGAPEAVVVVNERGFITYANPRVEQLVGHKPDSLRNQPFATLLADAGGIEEFMAELSPEVAAAQCDLDLRHSDGHVIHSSASTSSLVDGEGGQRHTVFFLRDVTDQRGVAAALERLNGELEHCVHSLAHDLRSPLVALLGFSRLLRQDYASALDETGRHFIDRIEQAGRTMDQLIHDLLEFSRIGQGGERSAMNDPRAVLLQIAAELKPRLDVADARLDLPDHPPLVYCDRTRLYQVFSNLLGNALDHMGPCDQPVISVSVWDDEGGHQIAVRDNGRGIAASEHERIFEVFQSLGPRSDGRRGSGLGLAIVKKIAETHAGRVWVESEPGAGATFHVLFPRG